MSPVSCVVCGESALGLPWMGYNVEGGGVLIACAKKTCQDEAQRRLDEQLASIQAELRRKDPLHFRAAP